MKLILFFILISLNSFAQTAITGKVIERGTKTPLKDVNVFILPLKLKATTNELGEFVFEDVPAGEFEFIVNLSGYIRLTQKASSENNNFNLYLEKEIYGVFETTVTALADKRDVTKKSLSQKDFLKAPGAQEDPVKAVQNLPGIANQSTSAQVVIQGSAPDDTRYTLNGHEIPIVFHFGGLSSIVMPQAVERVDFLASGFGPEYGRALGGIINLQTRSPKKDRTHGMAYVDLYNAGGLIEGKIDEKSSYFVSTRYSYIGQVLKKVAEDNEDFNLTVAPTFSDTFVSYERQLTPIDQLSLTFVRSKDELQFVLNQPIETSPQFRGDFYQKTEFYRFIPRWQRKISDTQKLDLSVGYGDNDILFEVGDNFFKLDTTTLSTRAELETRHSNSYTSFLGIDAQSTKYDVGLKIPRTSETGTSNGDLALAQITGENIENALYVRNSLKFNNEKIIFSPNIRLAHFSQTKESFLMPRLSLSYQYNDSISYTLATGLYYQGPKNGEAVEDVGNPDLKSEKAIHYTFGLEKDFREGNSNGLILGMDLFYKDLSQLIVATSETDSDGTPLVYSNKGKGKIKGIQTSLKWKKNEFAMVLAYTFLESLRTDPAKGEFPSEFDQTHNINVIASYERSRWTYSTRLRYVTGQPYTPIDSAIYDSDTDVYIPIQGEYFSKRYDSFFQLDLRFDRKWVYDTWILSAYLDIQNITNNQNVQSISYNYDYSDSSKTSGLPIIPIFGVKGEF